MRGRSSKTSTVPTTSPRIPTTPEVGWICAEHSCIRVVLPAPLGPRITQRSSSSTSQSTPSSRVAPPRLTVTSASSSTAFTNGTSAARSGSGGVARQPTRPRRRARRCLGSVHELAAGRRRPRHLAGRRSARGTSGRTTWPTPCGATTPATWSPGSTSARPSSCTSCRPWSRGRSRSPSRRRATCSGLGGPEALNLAALEAGRRWSSAPSGWSRSRTRAPWCGRAFPAARVPWVDERETAIELRTTLSEVTRRLVDLDVASWQPDIPDLLMNLRHRPRLPLPPRYDARRVETLERALLCLEIVRAGQSGRGRCRLVVRDAAACRGPGRPGPGCPAGCRRRLLGPHGLSPSTRG